MRLYHRRHFAALLSAGGGTWAAGDVLACSSSRASALGAFGGGALTGVLHRGVASLATSRGRSGAIPPVRDGCWLPLVLFSP